MGKLKSNGRERADIHSHAGIVSTEVSRLWDWFAEMNQVTACSVLSMSDKQQCSFNSLSPISFPTVHLFCIWHRNINVLDLWKTVLQPQSYRRFILPFSSLGKCNKNCTKFIIMDVKAYTPSQGPSFKLSLGLGQISQSM